ncbi:hypothetical protein [Desulfovulcanus sp.]
MDNLIVRIEKLIWRGRGLARLDSGQVLLVDPPILPDELGASVSSGKIF